MTRQQAEAQAQERRQNCPARIYVAELISKEAGWAVKSYPLTSRI